MLARNLFINVVSRKMGVLKTNTSGGMDMAQVKPLIDEKNTMVQKDAI